MVREEGEGARLTMPHGVFLPEVLSYGYSRRAPLFSKGRGTLVEIVLSKRNVTCLHCRKTLSRRRMGRHLSGTECGRLAAGLRSLRRAGVRVDGYQLENGVGRCRNGCGPLALYNVLTDLCACERCGTEVERRRIMDAA